MIIKRKKFLEKKPEPKKIEPKKPEPVYIEEITDVPEAENLSLPEPEPVVEEEPDIFEGFDFQNIDFNQRSERRRGDRRRGYRRIDDRNLISRAQEEAISIKEESAKEGYQEGLNNAQKDIEELKNSIDNFFAYKNELYEKLSGDILDIALCAAERIIKREVQTDRTILEDIVYDALENLAKDENKIILKVAPVDVEYAKEMVPELLETGQVDAKIFVTGDKNIDEGGVIIETSNGLIDANISTQLNVLKEAFKQI